MEWARSVRALRLRSAARRAAAKLGSRALLALQGLCLQNERWVSSDASDDCLLTRCRCQEAMNAGVRGRGGLGAC